MIIGIASGDYMPPHKHPNNIELWGGAGWARLGQYITGLRDLGHTVHSGVLWKAGETVAVETKEGDFISPDVIFLQRLMHAGLDQTIKSAKESGQIIINDIDDWYWGLDARNQAYLASHPKHNPKENTRWYWDNVMASSVVTVSTPYIRDKVRERGYKGEIVLLPNTIDVGRFNPVIQRELPTFGWAGSTGHRSGDLELLGGIFSKYLNAGAINLHHSGDGPDSPKFAAILRLDPSKVSTSPRSTTADYPSLLTMDVGLVPLRECAFNQAKSDIKGLEYAASGIPFIASHSASYDQLYKDWDGEGFFLASKKPKDWFRAIDTLIPLDIRKDYQKILLERVQTRDIRFGVANLDSFLGTLI